ncbi:MAG: class I SAM-dependent methyltransferase [Acidobacteriota bacterium]
MKRRQLVELEDLPWWPSIFRDAETDYLATALRFSKTYSVMAPRLAAALDRCGATQIVDLCSGAGGAWSELLPALRAAGAGVSLCLTDRYPNEAALARIASRFPGVRFETESVSATEVPARLTGFRTILTAFHHFPPAEARAILAAAVRHREGIAVFEAVSRTYGGLAAMLGVPLAVWLLTPVIRPFRWSRLFWTYLLPVVPAMILFDGVVSCLRIYTPDEMKAMALEVGGDAYDWEAGSVHPPGSPISIPYLIGVPRRSSAESFVGTPPV